jgi:NADH oxidase (H2O2-forming)
MKIVIAGNGIAGNEAAFYLKKYGSGMNITIISAEKFPEYDPCILPYYISGDVPRNFVFRKKYEDYEKTGINLIPESRVVSINSAAKRVITKKGDEYAYDRLILAHGGSLFIPSIEGVKKDGVLSCKHLSEADRLFSHSGKRAVVIGSGAIGIEAAEALKKKGYEVHIVELLGWILPTLFDEPTAKRLEFFMEGYGIRVFTGEKVLGIEGNDRVKGVVTDRREIPCDTVVIATGVVPGRELAETAGIEVGRGIKTDYFMETNVKDIYACGDCVETTDACTGEIGMYQLKHNAIDQARIAARNILGEKVAYPGAYVFARAHFFDTHAASFGKTMRGTECLLGDKDIIEKESGDDYLRIILADGKIAGAQAIGRFASRMGILMGAMWRKDDIYDLRKNMDKLSSPGCSFPWIHRRLGILTGGRGNSKF